MLVLRTTARLDDARRPACDARARRIQDVVRGRRAPGFDDPSLADGVRRCGSTPTVDGDPPTVRAARYGVDTTDGRRATRAPVEFKMSCAGDACWISTMAPRKANPDGEVLALGLPYRFPYLDARHSAPY